MALGIRLDTAAMKDNAGDIAEKVGSVVCGATLKIHQWMNLKNIIMLNMQAAVWTRIVNRKSTIALMAATDSSKTISLVKGVTNCLCPG